MNIQTQAFIAVTAQPIPYYADTTAIFNTLCQPNFLCNLTRYGVTIRLRDVIMQ
ncbi:TPA: hypothetical protein ACPPNE_001043 [Haemophilus influenzae]|uniref:hypothetical protein n=1 Tax=Haemophilus influenzae TaxID=727 RepID=UPI0013AF43AB|nr:hypothetical protein [Haemophilus influenzae]